MMADVRSTRQLRADGMDARALRRAVGEGSVKRVRRGAYRPAGEIGLLDEHRRLVEATIGEVQPGTVVSHASAAVLHGLVVRQGALRRVHLTRHGRGRRNQTVHVHPAPLLDQERTSVRGIPVTTMARTLADLGRSEELRWAVAGLDDALRRDLTSPADLAVAVERARGLPGIHGLRAAIALADARCESVGESLCRVAFHQWGLPAPVLQHEVNDGRGLVGRVDMAWPEHKVLVEFDGKVKYSSLVRPGETPSEVVWREKRREDRLRALGWQVVRVTWDEIFSAPEAVCRRVAAALWR